MRSSARWSAALRGLGQAALLPPAAVAVHQLRYLLAYGGGASLELQRTGHSYLHSLVPWLVMFVAVAVGGFLRALGRALAGQTSAARFSLSLVALWAVCTGTLVAIFASQEFLEGLFAAGHPVGLVGIFGYGGWWAVPAAACIGLVLATYFHGARWVVDAVARCHARRRGVTNRLSLEAAGAGAVLAAPPAPLVGGWSSRGPPGLS